MADQATGAVIVFNGEIYNFRELRKSLVRDGTTLLSGSDTEVVLRLFLRHGPACLLLLEGIFAVAIWDPNVGELFLARDRLGVKPLYVSEQAGCVLFASEVRALLASDCVDRRLDPEGVDSFLRFGAPREPHTIIANVRELPAATWLVMSAGRADRGTFWRMQTPQPEATITSFGINSYAEAAARVRELLFESVSLRLVSDVPVVTFLSGGIDSSCVVAAVREVTGDAPATIGVTFKEHAYSEAKYMRAVVDHFGCQHVNHQLSGGELLGLVPAAVKAMDQPTFDGVNTFVVSRVAAEAGFKVALSGVGGDELFGGYPSFQAAPFLTAVKRSRAAQLLAAAAGPLAFALPQGERRKKFKRWFRGIDLEGDACDLLRELFSRSERRQLLGASNERREESAAVVAPIAFGDVSRRELTQYMRNILLRDTDGLGMACSLEIREPYLHLPLVDLLLDLPDAWKRQRPRKALLREAMGDLLPLAVLRRPKRGFLLPFEVWLRTGSLRKEVERTLVESDAGLPGRDAVSGVWRDFQAGRTSWNRVWALYVLRKWVGTNVGSS
jgi:asparagine synthase (glutamine-hydrolysing)